MAFGPWAPPQLFLFSKGSGSDQEIAPHLLLGSRRRKQPAAGTTEHEPLAGHSSGIEVVPCPSPGPGPRLDEVSAAHTLVSFTELVGEVFCYLGKKVSGNT